MQVPDQIAKIVGDDRAVSPVIGVILMVAITVILAAVIGSFVLNIGGSQEVTPQASIDFDFDDGEELTIVHNGGDPIDPEKLSVSVVGDDTDINYDSSDNSEFSGAVGGSAFEAGNSVSVKGEDTISGGSQIQVVYTAESGQGSVLATFTIPEGSTL